MPSTLSQSVRGCSPTAMANVLRIINAAVGILLAFAGIWFFLRAHDGNVLRNLFAVYSIFFGALLFFFSIRFPGVVSFAATNFGFMFSFSGRAMMLLFISSLSLGLDTDFGKIIGAIILGSFIFTMFAFCINDGLANELRSETSHWRNLQSNKFSGNKNLGAQAASYAADNPEMAHRGVDVIVNNREAAKSVAQAKYGSTGSKAVDVIANNPNAAKKAIGFAAKNKDVAVRVAAGVWEEVKDPESGAVYWKDPNTGNTSWEKPN